MAILVVDDTRINQVMLEHLLTSPEVEVVCASNGPEALELAQARDFALVLLDVQMPVMDGYETARNLKAGRAAATPILFITSIFKDDQYVRQGYDAGGADYLFRPVDAKVLKGKVNAFLDLYRQRVLLEEEVARRRRMEDALRVAEVKYRTIFEKAAEGIFLSTPDGTFREANGALARILGFDEPADLLGVPGLAASMGVDNVGRDDYLHRLKTEGSVTDWQYQIRRQDGEIIWLSESARWVEGAEILIEGIVEDITERKESELDLRRRAHHDSLTGVPNRHSFLMSLRRELAESRRVDGRLAVLFIDLDEFKAVNDVHGHAAGDALLRQVAQRLTSRIRSSDVLARLGGDEFGVLLTGVSGLRDAEKVAAELCETLSTPFDVETARLKVSCTVGVSLYPDHGQDDAILVSRADTAMYAAKKTGVPYLSFSLKR